VKEKFLSVTETELQNLVAYKPNDARVHVFLASYYRTIGNNEKAQESLRQARELTPKKQSVILQQGAVALAQGKNDEALAFFKESFELDTRNGEAREYYVTLLYITGAVAEAQQVTQDGGEDFKNRIVSSDFYLSGANTAKDYAAIAEVYETRVSIDASVAQNWASLAYTYYQMKDIPKAIETLERGAKAVPSFASTSQCVIKNLQTGKNPEALCQ
jgi:tetratricopeptide (TPR) repeat protein